MSQHDTETIEDVKPALAAAKYFVKGTASLSFDFGAASHTGLRRKENQDHYIVLRRTRTQQLLLTNLPTDQLSLPNIGYCLPPVATSRPACSGLSGSGPGAGAICWFAMAWKSFVAWPASGQSRKRFVAPSASTIAS